NHGRSVEQLVRRASRHRTATDTTDIVEPCLQTVEAHLFEPAPDFRHFAEGEPAQLNLLAGRQIDKSLAILIRQIRNHPELGSVGPAGIEAYPQHETPGSGLAEEQPIPLGPLLVVFRHLLPVVVSTQTQK